MSIYCNYQDEDFDDIYEAGCEECNHQCDRYRRLMKETEVDDDKFAQLRNSEFAKEITTRLANLLNFPTERTDQILNSLFNRIENTAESMLKECITKAVQIKVVKHFDNNIQSMIDECFKKVVEEKIIFIQNNEKAFSETIRNRITERISKSFKDSRGREYSDRLDQAVKDCVDARVKEATSELIKETQDKFSKEAMKRMMSGMAKAIGEDKKLLTLLTS